MLVGAPMEHPARVEEVVHIAHLLVAGADLVALVLHLDNSATAERDGQRDINKHVGPDLITNSLYTRSLQCARRGWRADHGD